MDSPEDFAYALHYAPSYEQSTINILTDLDMNGGNQVFSKQGIWTGTTLQGNNHTIYNLHIAGTGTAGLCSQTTSCTLYNVTFDTPHFHTDGTGDYNEVGLIPVNFDVATNKVVMTNCTIQNGLFNTMQYSSSKMPHIGAFAGYVWGMELTNCISKNNTIIGNDHVGGVCGEYEASYFYDCASENNTVIAYGGHSGAFASCSNTWGEFYRCWSNSTIYGNRQVGGFTSGCDGAGQFDITDHHGATYEDCFSAGVVEGNSELGGFIGFSHTYSINFPQPTYRRCYSTTMVGMNYQGSILGGFVGNMKTGIFIDCYAAGEVGSIDTDINSTVDVGGFVGILGNASFIEPTVQNCYYDMQTTAMKNKAIGSSPLLSMIRNSSGVSTPVTHGIQGLTTRKLTGACNIFSSGYVYTQGLYPQLLAMNNHTNIKFRAQSAASTATVFCNDWSDIKQTGFDTVRDTMRNYSFSSIEKFGSNTQFASAHIVSDNISNVTWDKDDNISPVDRTSPVIQLAENPYYTTSISPGIEWVEVSLEYTDESSSAIGNRRLRLIPTSVIETGGDKRVDVFYDGADNETSPYDHKEGFATTYLDAATLQSYLDSDTAHPEALQTFEQITSQQYADGIISGTMSLPFNSKVTNFAITASMTHQDGSPASIDNLFEKLNGTMRFEAADCGMYKIVYKASLDDGRYLSIGKKLIVVGPWSVVYNYNYDGLLGGDKISPDSIFYIQSNLMDFSVFVLGQYGDPPIRDGWQFAYWSLDRDGKQPIDQTWFDNYEKNYGVLNRNIDIYAQWNRLSPTSAVTLDIDPDIGSYNGKANGEHTTLEGAPGDKIVLDAAVPPEKFLFDEWNDTPSALGGGSLEYFDETGKWIFTFGDADATLQAKYKQNIFECTIRWVNKHTGEDIIESHISNILIGESIIFRTDAVDDVLYNIDAAQVTIYDADTNEEISWEDISLTQSDNDKYELSGILPDRNIRIDIIYDTWIQMPETGSVSLSLLIFCGAAILCASIAILILRNVRLADN